MEVSDLVRIMIVDEISTVKVFGSVHSDEIRRRRAFIIDNKIVSFIEFVDEKCPIPKIVYIQTMNGSICTDTPLEVLIELLRNPK